jgi:hypothetical protein
MDQLMRVIGQADGLRQIWIDPDRLAALRLHIPYRTLDRKEVVKKRRMSVTCILCRGSSWKSGEEGGLLVVASGYLGLLGFSQYLCSSSM